MFGLFTKHRRQKKSSGKSVREIAEREFRENRKVLESLRDYDAGKKEISTRDIQERMRSL